MSHVTKPPVWLYIRQKWGMYNSNTQDNNSQLLRDKGKGEAPSLSQARDAALCHNRSELHFDKQRLQSASDLQRGQVKRITVLAHCTAARLRNTALLTRERRIFSRSYFYALCFQTSRLEVSRLVVTVQGCYSPMLVMCREKLDTNHSKDTQQLYM